MMYARWGVGALLLIVLVGAAKGVVFAPRDPAVLSFTTIAGHEWHYNLWRIVAMADALADAMPGRWLQAFSHGWGYPLFHYTSPLPYTVGATFVLLGFDAHAALNLCWILALSGSGLIMFFACRPIFGRWGALLSAAAYLFAPYHLVDIYVRTNLVETTAFLFPPIIIWALWRCREEAVRPVVVGAVAVALLPLSHMLSTYLAGVGLAVFCAVYLLLLPAGVRRRFAQRAALMGALGLGLSAFFWLPAVADLAAVRGTEAIVAGTYDYQRHFVYPAQLFSRRWTYGGSDVGPDDGMSFSLGLPIVILGVIAGIAAVALAVKARRDTGSAAAADSAAGPWRLVIAALVTATAMAFITLGTSQALWTVIPGIELVQFPWRFLMPASLFLAVAAGGLPRLAGAVVPARPWVPAAVGVAAALAIMALHWDYARQGTHETAGHDKLTEAFMLEEGVWTTNQLEFMPADAQSPNKEAQRIEAAWFVDSAYVPQPRILNSEMQNGKVRIDLVPGAAGRLIVNQHWHPAWKASVNGRTAVPEPFRVHPLVPAVVNVPAGAREVELRYGFTGWGKLGLALSALVFAGGAGYLAVRRERALLKDIAVPAAYLGVTLVFWTVTAQPHSESLQETFERTAREIDAADYTQRKPAGLSWDHRSNAPFDRRGLRIRFEKVRHSPAVEFSLDSNDQYLILYARGGEAAEEISTVPARAHAGLSGHTVAVPAAVVERGYDAVAVIPASGDDRYSLGHIRTDLDRASLTRDAAAGGRHNLPKYVALNALATPRRRGTPWDAPGNVLFDEAGVDVKLTAPASARRLSVSLDNNDQHLLVFLRDAATVATAVVDRPENFRGVGLAVHSVTVPEQARQAGFDTIGIRPVAGDGYYALGHMILRDY